MVAKSDLTSLPPREDAEEEEEAVEAETEEAEEEPEVVADLTEEVVEVAEEHLVAVLSSLQPSLVKVSARCSETCQPFTEHK